MDFLIPASAIIDTRKRPTRPTITNVLVLSESTCLEQNQLPRLSSPLRFLSRSGALITWHSCTSWRPYLEIEAIAFTCGLLISTASNTSCYLLTSCARLLQCTTVQTDPVNPDRSPETPYFAHPGTDSQLVAPSHPGSAFSEVIL